MSGQFSAATRKTSVLNDSPYILFRSLLFHTQNEVNKIEGKQDQG